MSERIRYPQAAEEDMQVELDGIVLEAIENIVSTSRRMRDIQMRRHPREANFDRKKHRPAHPNDTRLRSEQSDEDYRGYDDDTCQLPAMSGRQREYAEDFSQWLIQQDNYPIILHHIEEMLETLSEEIVAEPASPNDHSWQRNIDASDDDGTGTGTGNENDTDTENDTGKPANNAPDPELSREQQISANVHSIRDCSMHDRPEGNSPGVESENNAQNTHPSD